MEKENTDLRNDVNTNDKLSRENADLNAKYAKLSAQSQQLQQSFRTMEKENTDLRSDVNTCKSEALRVGQEKAQLDGQMQQSMKLEKDMANEIQQLKATQALLSNQNQDCR